MSEKEIVVYAVESGSIHDGGGLEDVYLTLEGALSSKPDHFKEIYKETYHENGELDCKVWQYKNEYFWLTRIVVTDEVKEDFKLNICSFKGCKFRDEDYYYSFETDKAYRNICSECGPEACKDTENMLKALE